jgi:hypothetical protein
MCSNDRINYFDDGGGIYGVAVVWVPYLTGIGDVLGVVRWDRSTIGFCT